MLFIHHPLPFQALPCPSQQLISAPLLPPAVFSIDVSTFLVGDNWAATALHFFEFEVKPCGICWELLKHLQTPSQWFSLLSENWGHWSDLATEVSAPKLCSEFSYFDWLLASGMYISALQIFFSPAVSCTNLMFFSEVQQVSVPRQPVLIHFLSLSPIWRKSEQYKALAQTFGKALPNGLFWDRQSVSP